MTRKYTPGPWKITYSDGLGYGVGPEKDEEVAHIHGHESKANARLIAASVDLLEACKEVRRAYPRSPWIHEMVDKAIAKAEGKSEA